MEFDPLKPIVFKELSTRDKFFLIIMVVLVIVGMTHGGGDDSSYYVDESPNYSPSQKEYEDAFREADRAKKYLDEYNMKKKIERNIRGF